MRVGMFIDSLIPEEFALSTTIGGTSTRRVPLGTTSSAPATDAADSSVSLASLRLRSALFSRIMTFSLVVPMALATSS
ncbi:MAG: hypothetical protein RXP91_04190 [Nitrososphaeria archaeon]|jgi:hypothetical protein